MQGRRLDYDCKRRKQAKGFYIFVISISIVFSFECPKTLKTLNLFCFVGSHVSDEELKQAEEKFAESLHSAQIGMFSLLENDVSYL